MGIPDDYIYKFLDVVKDTGEFMTKSLDVKLIETRMIKTSKLNCHFCWQTFQTNQKTNYLSTSLTVRDLN